MAIGILVALIVSGHLNLKNTELRLADTIASIALAVGLGGIIGLIIERITGLAS
jgi:hypothetical protein